MKCIFCGIKCFKLFSLDCYTMGYLTTMILLTIQRFLLYRNCSDFIPI